MWNFRVMEVPRAFIKSKPLERNLYATTPLFLGAGPDTRRGILKSLYGLESACRECCETLKTPYAYRGEAALLEKLVFSWPKKDFNYVFGKWRMCKSVGRNGEGFSRRIAISELMKWGSCMGVNSTCVEFVDFWT